MTKATYDDVNLILRLYEIRREEKLRAARAWFVGNFKVKTLAEFNQLCPPGSSENAQARMVISYWDMAASFISAGVLSPELFFDSSRELLVVWIRIRAYVNEARAAFKDSTYARHLESAASSCIEYWNKTSPGAYEAFVARIGG